ncbi:MULTISPECIES: histidine kinase [unclassified Streptomyces]|uniref:sensor histidine kinase n=1 Tax=unclassified Streptomyces TaxID=2593676 RepID=UPI002DD9A1FC|nr:MULTISPECIES: histidine kinase [unclassified Streptomyces]WSA95239.1 histidine kinase [Streptomyces sp. NBC_01795]WSB79657.1 histidine kinase [Streptomyces sp. NBC_01775]WSS40851.1 histidine kinase [Streptomyces sp. NBC_01187]
MPAVTLREIRERLRAHPHAVDVLLAMGTFGCILLSAATEPHGPNASPHFAERGINGQTVLLAALACGVLTLRRRAPLPVLMLTSLISVIALVVDTGTAANSGRQTTLVFAAVIALYTFTNTTGRTTGWRVGATTVVVLTGAGMLFGARPWYAQENLGILAWTGLAAAVGEAVRNRRAFVAAIRERAERAERTREEEARRRVAEERMRIARELHDVVAHHIALVNVQAGVASHVMDQRPDQAKQALAHVREASRHALGELQTTVGLLRQSGESAAPTEPAPGLAVLDDLVAGFRRAGLSVDLSAPPPGEDGQKLSSAVDLTAYRVVQEALTNVQKHVGSGAHAEVGIGRADGALEITVVDDGAGHAAQGGDDTGDPEPGEPGAGGHGLVGMRERAAALHGECETGPLPGGGFRVHVRLPLETAARREETPA